MKQSESQIIGRKAQRIFEYITPSYCPLRSQHEDDFGVDYEWEIFSSPPDSRSTGIIAKIQLKGTESANYIENGKYLSFSFNVDNAKYLIDEITFPSYLIVCDNNKEHCYWISFQTNKDLLDSYHKATTNNQDTFTIHIPTSSNFKNDLSLLITDIQESLKILGIKTLHKLRNLDIYKHIDVMEEDKTIEVLISEIENAELSKLSKFIYSKRFQDALNLIQKVKESSDRSLMYKFNVLLWQEPIFKEIIFSSSIPQREMLRKYHESNLDIAQELTELTQNCNDEDASKKLSKIHKNIAENSIFGRQIMEIHLNFKLHKTSDKTPDMIWIMSLENSKIQLTNEIIKNYNEIQVLSHDVAMSNYCFYIPCFVQKFIIAMSDFNLSLLLENHTDTFNQIEKYFDGLILVSLKFYKLSGDWDNYLNLLITRTTYKLLKLNNCADLEVVPAIEKDIINEFTPLINDIESPAIRGEALNYVTSTIKKMCSSSKDNFSIEEEIEFYKNQVKAFGIDIDNPEDKIAQAVKIAIDDINPERVLKNCQNLYLYSANVSDVGRWLKLTSMGFKGLYCTKNCHRMEGFSLDSLWSIYNLQFCSKCKDKKPHPKDWQWSRKWHLEKDKKYHKIIKPNLSIEF